MLGNDGQALSGGAPEKSGNPNDLSYGYKMLAALESLSIVVKRSEALQESPALDYLKDRARFYLQDTHVVTCCRTLAATSWRNRKTGLSEVTSLACEYYEHGCDCNVFCENLLLKHGKAWYCLLACILFANRGRVDSLRHGQILQVCI